MPTYCATGETIEGEKAYVDARKLILKGLLKHPIYQKRMILYKGDRNCNAIVEEAGTIPQDTDIREKTKTYHRNVGDELKSDAIAVYIDSCKPIRYTIEHGSHRHETHVMRIPKQTIATITTPLANITSKLDLEKKSIEVITEEK